MTVKCYPHLHASFKFVGVKAAVVEIPEEVCSAINAAALIVLLLKFK